MFQQGEWLTPDDADDRFGILLDQRIDVFLGDSNEMGAVSLALFTQDAALVWSRRAPRSERFGHELGTGNAPDA